MKHIADLVRKRFNKGVVFFFWGVGSLSDGWKFLLFIGTTHLKLMKNLEYLSW